MIFIHNGMTYFSMITGLIFFPMTTNSHQYITHISLFSHLSEYNNLCPSSAGQCNIILHKQFYALFRQCLRPQSNEEETLAPSITTSEPVRQIFYLWGKCITIILALKRIWRKHKTFRR